MTRLRNLAGLLVVLGVLGAGGWAGWRAWGRRAVAPPAQEPLAVSARADRGDLLITVDETGVLEATDSTPVIPEVPGRLLFICDSGIAVAEGDVIALLDPADAQEQVTNLTVQLEAAMRQLQQARERGRAQVAESELRLRSAREQAEAFARQQQARLREMADRIAYQEAELQRRRPELEAKQRMAAKGLIAGTEVEREQAALHAAEFALQRDRSNYALEQANAEAQILEQRKRVDNAEHDLALARRQAEREARMQQNQVDNLRLRLQRAQADLQKTTVTAPRAGIVVLSAQSGRWGGAELPRVGDRIWEGRELAQVVNLDKMQIKLELDQPRVARVRVGQEVLVQVDAIPDRKFRGKVIEIGATARRPPLEGWRGFASEMTFPVTIELRSLHPLLRPGMRANVSIITRRVKDVVIVPSECLFERDGQWVVFVETPQGYRRTPVKRGESNGDFTAILAGLAPGQRVALNDPEAPGGGAAAQTTKAGSAR